jgi:hypothetical protein
LTDDSLKYDTPAGADGIDGHYWQHMTDRFEEQQDSSAFKNASLKALKCINYQYPRPLITVHD